MKMQEIEELKHKVQVQRGILYTCRDTFNDIKYLQGNDDISEDEKDLLQFYQWRFIQELMWRYLILELSKLFSKSKNDKYRIEAVLNFLNLNCNKPPLNELVKKASIEELLKEFNSDEFQRHYDKLIKIRDKYVAHLDRNPTDLRIDNEDIDYFLKLSEGIIKEVIDPIEIGGGSYYSGKPATLKSFIGKMAEYKGVYDKLEVAIIDPNKRKHLKPGTEADLLRILGKRNFVMDGIG